MTHLVSAEENDVIRIEENGAGATIRILGEQAMLLFMQVPEEERRQGRGRALLAAAETESSAHGAKKLCMEYSDYAEGFFSFLEACGYQSRDTGSILSIRTSDLLESEGVQKSLRMRFRDIKTSVLDDLLMFEWEDISDLLNKCRFEMRPENMSRFSPALSFVSYDGDYRARAVLLSTFKKELFVELLLGFSNKNPEFILCVCQEFVRALTEQKEELPDRIFLYSSSEYVITLVRRLLDREYDLHREKTVWHAEKELAEGAVPLQRAQSEASAGLWKTESEQVFAQQNITEKTIWQSLRR